METLTQRQKSIKWWNTLGSTKQNDLALDYYGSTLVMDDEVEFIFLREVIPPKLYTEEEIYQLFEKLTVRGVFKTDRDYEVAKQTLLELTGIDYEQEIK